MRGIEFYLLFMGGTSKIYFLVFKIHFSRGSVLAWLKIRFRSCWFIINIY